MTENCCRMDRHIVPEILSDCSSTYPSTGGKISFWTIIINWNIVLTEIIFSCSGREKNYTKTTVFVCVINDMSMSR